VHEKISRNFNSVDDWNIRESDDDEAIGSSVMKSMLKELCGKSKTK
jgi:hypothetical protein